MVTSVLCEQERTTRPSHCRLLLQVFDCGLIGEGALHLVAAARAQGLLQPGARVLPAAATVRACA